jgi:hypothetical protein
LKNCADLPRGPAIPEQLARGRDRVTACQSTKQYFLLIEMPKPSFPDPNSDNFTAELSSEVSISNYGKLSLGSRETQIGRKMKLQILALVVLASSASIFPALRLAVS